MQLVVCCVRYSWDGQYLATGSNRAAQVYEVYTGTKLASCAKEDVPTLEDESHVSDICFSPSCQWLATAAEEPVVKVWGVLRRTVKHQLVGHDGDISSVDVSVNSRFIVSGSVDKQVKLWNLKSGELLATIGEEDGPSGRIVSVCVSPTSQLVAVGSLDKIVRVWDVESNRLVQQLEGHGDSVLTRWPDKTLKLWTSPLKIHHRSGLGLKRGVPPNSKFVISGSRDRTARFWDPRHSSTKLQLQGHRNSVVGIAHNPRSQSLATGCGDWRARLWTYTRT